MDRAIFSTTPPSDVDGDSKRQREETCQQRPVYQQDVPKVRRDTLATGVL